MELVPTSPPGDDADRKLTPRQARAFTLTATTLAATAYGDADALAGRLIESEDQGSLLAMLPSVTWAQDTGWRRRMARAFDDLAEDVDAGRNPEPTCTGEEMALHLVLATASGHHFDGDFEVVLADLPEHLDDRDWDAPADFLFQDHDVLTLYEPEPVHDGLNLDPEDWFVPFEAGTERDPDRGFRF